MTFEVICHFIIIYALIMLAFIEVLHKKIKIWFLKALCISELFVFFANLVRPILFSAKKKTFLLLPFFAKPVFKNGFRNQTWVTAVLNRFWRCRNLKFLVWGYRTCQMTGENVAALAKWRVKMLPQLNPAFAA